LLARGDGVLEAGLPHRAHLTDRLRLGSGGVVLLRRMEDLWIDAPAPRLIAPRAHALTVLAPFRGKKGASEQRLPLPGYSDPRFSTDSGADLSRVSLGAGKGDP